MGNQSPSTFLHNPENKRIGKKPSRTKSEKRKDSFRLIRTSLLGGRVKERRVRALMGLNGPETSHVQLFVFFTTFLRSPVPPFFVQPSTNKVRPTHERDRPGNSNGAVHFLLSGPFHFPDRPTMRKTPKFDISITFLLLFLFDEKKGGVDGYGANDEQLVRRRPFQQNASTARIRRSTADSHVHYHLHGVRRLLGTAVPRRRFWRTGQ